MIVFFGPKSPLVLMGTHNRRTINSNYMRKEETIIKGKKLSSFDLFKTRTERNIIHHDETVCYDIRKKIMNKIGKD